VSFDTKLEQRLQETGSMRTSTIANLDEGGGGAKGDNNKEGGIKPVIPTQSAEELFNVMSPVITNQGKVRQSDGWSEATAKSYLPT